MPWIGTRRKGWRGGRVLSEGERGREGGGESDNGDVDGSR